MQKKVMLVTTALVLMALPTLTHAQSSGAEQMSRARQRLAAACSGKAPEAPCSFTRRDGKPAHGTCVTSQNQMLCMTPRMMKRMQERMQGMGGGGMMDGAPGGGTGGSGMGGAMMGGGTGGTPPAP